MKLKKYQSAEKMRRKRLKEEDRALLEFMEGEFKTILSREEKKLKAKQSNAL